MSPHEHFEELCALAIRDEIREDEAKELTEHLQCCADCRETATRLHGLGLILARGAEANGELSVPADMRARFVARARFAGIPLTLREEASTDRPRLFRLKPLILSGLSAAVLFAVVFSLGIRYAYRRSVVSSRPQSSIPAATPPGGTNATPFSEDQQLKDELFRASKQVVALSAQIKQQQSALDSLQQAKDQLTLQLAQLTATNETLQNERSQRTAEIATLNAQLEKVRSEENTRQAALLDAQAALRNEKLVVSDLESELAAAKQLNAALGEARELITARNLHVKDIPPEIGGNGSPQKAFGRVFYAEGRRLDFYAYDLADLQGLPQRESFYVWREASGPKEQIAKLGQLQIDNEKDGRWVLRVTDPTLVTHLSSVFVTLESDAKAVTQPTGKRMLFAFLGNQANHP